MEGELCAATCPNVEGELPGQRFLIWHLREAGAVHVARGERDQVKLVIRLSKLRVAIDEAELL